MLKLFSLRCLCLVSLGLFLFAAAIGVQAKSSSNVIDSYIDKWTHFYPSAAFSQGLTTAAWQFENFSEQRTAQWLTYNRHTLKKLPPMLNSPLLSQRIDAHVLMRQIELELERWQQDQVLKRQPQWYAEMISQALTYVLVREQLSPDEKFKVLLKRLAGVQSLCALGVKSLDNGSRRKTLGAVDVLDQTALFYQQHLLKISSTWTNKKNHKKLQQMVHDTAKQIHVLANHIRNSVLPNTSLPDNMPGEKKVGFYRSFNHHFNTMIISHEIFPGHYLQAKVAVTRAPSVRSLFANDIYVEGWGSFSEVLMLDAGWAAGQRLTRLAHLRKRLENATRAYASVMVHTEGWSKDRLTAFATKRGLLPPQFAINLWVRVMNTPLQLTSYFIGFQGIQQLWEEEKKRLGNNFITREFVDKTLRAGSVSIDSLRLILQKK